jgi:hypothetical protein
VKPETASYLEKSRDLLGRADTMMGAGLTDDAGRTVYLAGLHAAQAFIFENKRPAVNNRAEITRHARICSGHPRVAAVTKLLKNMV